MEGPGQSPESPQPMPKSTEPSTRLRPSFGSGGAGKLASGQRRATPGQPPGQRHRHDRAAHDKGQRRIPIAKDIEPALHLGGVGHARDEQPAPNSDPASKAIRYRIRSLPEGGGTTRPSAPRRRYRTPWRRCRAATAAKCHRRHGRRCSHWPARVPMPTSSPAATSTAGLVVRWVSASGNSGRSSSGRTKTRRERSAVPRRCRDRCHRPVHQ